MPTNRFLVIDFETRSEADLRQIGAVEYAKHPTTQILCIGWKYGTRGDLEVRKAKVWSPAMASPYGELRDALCDPEVILVAHNAMFEQSITRYTLPRILNRSELKTIPSSRWICTASLARALALPGNLEGACQAIRLPVQKDMEGRRLMLKLAKPRKATKLNSAKWHNSKADLERIMQYCATDVDAEALLLLTLPPLNPTERKVWELDQKINWRGFAVDRPLVAAVLRMVDEETQYLNEETYALTDGMVRSMTQRDAGLRWLSDVHGLTLPDLTAKTLVDVLEGDLAEGKARRLLEIRQSIARTSTAKYEAFRARSETDGRCRDNLIYHTASTGRWGGAGVQPQNFPRGSIKNTTLAAEILTEGDLELTRLIYGNPMDVFSSCLRSVIIAPLGKELFCADYAAIEARVLFWIAKHEDGLAAFRDSRPLYEEMAMKIYSTTSITKEQREIGKRAVLGCGYGMGSKKFKDTCKMLGNIEIPDELAELAVKVYRETHPLVPKLWSNLEKAAIYAVREKKRVTVNHTTWWVEKNFLWCELPSKRRLAYYHPEIRYDTTPWGEKRPTLYHQGIHPKTKKWEAAGTYGGRLTENVVQAVARDFMAEAMLRIEDAGYEIVLSVHDEILAERVRGKGRLQEFENLMSSLPSWGTGCPIKVEGWTGDRYRK